MYNDRVYTFRRIVEIDSIIDNNPSIALVKELAELRVRNLCAFNELQSYNDNKTFLYKHPLVSSYSLTAELAKLLRENPARFLKDYAAVNDNIKRYESYLRSNNRSEEKKKNDKANLVKHRQRAELMSSILSDSR